MAHVSEAGIKLIHRFEGVRLEAYDDGTGVWTIGWGHTGLVDNRPVAPGMTVTKLKADWLFVSDLRRFEVGVENALIRSATQGQFDAMVSLAYNIGLGGFGRSQVLKRFNAGDFDGAAEKFIEWILPPVAMRGLARRRAAEIVRFLSAA